MNVSVRDLKNGLSAYLRLVRRGERIVVTCRGEPVAELSPAAETSLSLDRSLAKLAESGELRLPKRRRPIDPIARARVRGPAVASTVLEDRD
jgi:prevent-host-death family protein